MAEPIQYIKSIVNCDHCDFDQEIDRNDLSDWLNVKCPDCGNILIDEHDMKVAAATTLMADLINGLIGDVDESKMEQEEIIIDSNNFKS